VTGAEKEIVSSRKQLVHARELPSANPTALFVIGSKIFYFALFIYPYTFIWSQFHPILVGPIHLQILIPSLLLFLAAILQPVEIIRKLGPSVLLVLWLSIIILCIQALFGRISIDSLPLMRVLYTVPLFWSLYTVYIGNSARRQTVRKIILWNCIIVAICGAAHSLFFPGGGREASFLGGANVYANFLVVGLIVISTLKRSTTNILLTIMLFISTTLAASRWAFVIAAIMLYKITIHGKGRALRRVLIATSCVVLLAIIAMPILNHTAYTAKRLITSPFLVGRGQKWVIGLEALLASETRFLFGGLTTFPGMLFKNGMSFSDNSFITIMLQFGVPIAILWIGGILLNIIPFRISGKHKIVPVYFWGTLLLNNAILWDIWLLYIMGALLCSSRYADDRD
jgi:hypothetical protein